MPRGLDRETAASLRSVNVTVTEASDHGSGISRSAGEDLTVGETLRRPQLSARLLQPMAAMDHKLKARSGSSRRKGDADKAAPVSLIAEADAPRSRKGKQAHLSIPDVASRAGVSIATVSRVVNEEARGVSHQTRARVQSVIKEMNYLPNRLGRALRAQTS